MEGALISLCALIGTQYHEACHQTATATIIQLDYRPQFQAIDRKGQKYFKQSFTEKQQAVIIGVGAAVLIIKQQNVTVGLKNVLFSDVASITFGKDFLIKLTWSI